MRYQTEFQAMGQQVETLEHQRIVAKQLGITIEETGTGGVFLSQGRLLEWLDQRGEHQAEVGGIRIKIG